MSNKKTICVVMGGHFSSSIGGSQYQAKCLVEGLKKSNLFDIHYVTRSSAPDYKPVGYQIRRIGTPHGIRKYSFTFDAPKLLSLLRELKPDVIYQRELMPYTGVIAFYARKVRCKTVLHIASDHSLLPPRLTHRSGIQWLRHLDKRLAIYGLNNVTSVIAQTQFQAKLLQSNFGRSATAVIPNFHPIAKEELVKRTDEVRVIWVANFKPIKNPEIFVRLAQDLVHREDIKFVMIGRGGKPERYGNLHTEIERVPNLTYLGELSIEDVNRQLAMSHVFINTSEAEGFPNTFIQAWMRRVPTVTLSVNPDGVFDSESFGFCARSYEALRERVLELANNPRLRQQMGVAAEKYAFDNHSPQVVERLISLLDDV